MEFSSLIDKYNTSDLKINELLILISKDLGLEINPSCTYWFSKDIMSKTKIVKPITLVHVGNSYNFLCNNEELFKISKKPYQKYDSNDSLLRTSILPITDESGFVCDISNDQFFLGKNGLYEKEDLLFNKYRYITFTDKNKIYYEAYVDKDNGTITKNYFDKNGDVESRYFYSFVKKEKDTSNLSSAINKIEKFLNEDFSQLNGYMYSLVSSDLIDQYYYDIKLLDKTLKYKDIYITSKTKSVTDSRDKEKISGINIIGNQRNKENYIAISNCTLPELKLLCVTDFVNGNKLDKSLNKYITAELKDWFNDLDAYSLKDEERLLMSLGDKILDMNKFIYDQVKRYKRKNNNNDFSKVIGSALGLSLITKTNTYIINYGDTRVYSYIDSDLSQLTADDTIVWDLYKKNELTYDETISYQKGSILTNYIGNPETYMRLPELFSMKNDKYDKLFVFSDGITDNLTDSSISNIIRVNDGVEALREIANQAYKKQTRHDDITGCCLVKR